MTHRDEIKRLVLWCKKDEWYDYSDKHGYYLTSEAPPEAVESFKQWAAYQDSLGNEGLDYSLALR